MKLQRLGFLAGIALTATVALAACGSNNGGSSASSGSSLPAGCASGSLNGQGSTAQANAMAEWIKDFNTKCNNASTINYNANGSGAGQQAFISGTADFAGSDSALKPADQTSANARCKTGVAIHLPMVVGPIAVAYNLSGVTNLQLKPATLAGIFSGKITKWNDAAIAADNPGVTLPATAIMAVHRSDSSGTTDNFTKYLTGTAGSAWTYDHDKVWKAPGGDAEKGNDGVGAQIKKTDGAVGYVEWSFAALNNLSIAKIFNGAGEWSQLTADSAGKTLEGAQITGTGNDLQMTIDYNTKTAGAYPIVLVTYEIVCDKGNTASTLPLLKAFLTFTSSTDGQSKLTSIGYAPLPETVRTKVSQVVSTLS